MKSLVTQLTPLSVFNKEIQVLNPPPPTIELKKKKKKKTQFELSVGLNNFFIFYLFFINNKTSLKEKKLLQKDRTHRKCAEEYVKTNFN